MSALLVGISIGAVLGILFGVWIASRTPKRTYDDDIAR